MRGRMNISISTVLQLSGSYFFYCHFFISLVLYFFFCFLLSLLLPPFSFLFFLFSIFIAFMSFFVNTFILFSSSAQKDVCHSNSGP